MEKTREEILYELLVEKCFAPPFLKGSIPLSKALDQRIAESSIRDRIFKDEIILTELLKDASIVEKIIILEVLSLRERVAQLEEVVDMRWYRKSQELFVNVQEQQKEIASLKSKLRGITQISDERLQKIKEVLEMSVPACLKKFVPYPNWNVRIHNLFKQMTVMELLGYNQERLFKIRNFGRKSLAVIENMLKCAGEAIGFEFMLGMDLSFLSD